MDECTSAYFPDIDIDLNLRRSYGLIAILGYQGRSQLLDRYGQNKAANIETGTVTKMIFKTIDSEYQQILSRSLGDKEVKIESYSHNSTGRSRSENIQRVPLWESYRFEQMDQGELILKNSGYKSKKRASLPLHIPKVLVAQEIFDLEQRCQWLFEQKIRPRMIHNAQSTGLQLDNRALELELLDRMAYADMMLPEPDELDAAILLGKGEKGKG